MKRKVRFLIPGRTMEGFLEEAASKYGLEGCQESREGTSGLCQIIQVTQQSGILKANRGGHGNAEPQAGSQTPFETRLRFSAWVL